MQKITPSFFNDVCVVTTILSLPGNGRPIESHVFLPIIIGLFIVNFLKLDKSDGKSHGIDPLLPITPFSATATIKLKLNIVIPLLEQEYEDENHSPLEQNLQN